MKEKESEKIHDGLNEKEKSSEKEKSPEKKKKGLLKNLFRTHAMTKRRTAIPAKKATSRKKWYM
ncbi:hypothetical protein [Acetivibrio straminisolvens]|uniref:Uncharacterized protein n=1 Tax=Acetivibrio straminisolvens JCM 21531 TaxID=1294263 RepID=W4V818_9FIRM|nr:hypothetical protein [Acetivibrio straminisolvens]GAE89331.1 hypothetical protein JCM21531_2844 [Acetivibrio straminisolvens JCM 21531]